MPRRSAPLRQQGSASAPDVPEWRGLGRLTFQRVVHSAYAAVQLQDPQARHPLAAASASELGLPVPRSFRSVCPVPLHLWFRSVSVPAPPFLPLQARILTKLLGNIKSSNIPFATLEHNQVLGVCAPGVMSDQCLPQRRSQNQQHKLSMAATEPWAVAGNTEDD